MVRSTTARRKKKRREIESDAQIELLRPETVRGAIGILLAAAAIFLAITPFGIAGPTGEALFEILAFLVGKVGYILVPLSAGIAAVMLFLSHERHISILKWLSSGIFLIASLGLVHVALPGYAGILGGGIASLLVGAIATPATVVFLLAFIVASLLVALDAHPHALIEALKRLFTPRESEEDAVLEETLNVSSGVVSDDEEDEEEVSPKPSLMDRVLKQQPALATNPILMSLGEEYTPPPISLLGGNKGKPEVGDVKANANIIRRTLLNFGISVEMDEVSIGPTVTRYSMKPAEGVRLSKILTLQSNLELALAASPVRIEAPIPGKALVGIEVPNQSRTTLGLAPLMSDTTYTQSDKPLLVALGRTITGTPHYTDLARTPHLLIAGATGAGKSVTIHDIVISLLYRCGPDQLRFVMIDPKRVELTMYNSIPHLLTPVITDAKRAILSLKWLAKEMDRRYDVLESEHVRDISSYHATILKPALEKARKKDSSEGLPEPMPYIVVILDELADIMQTYPRELESGIVRLAQMSRAVGIHLVLSTQRPSVKVITGLIKANVPARLALQVASQIDSRTILDMGGAEKLLGAGDMLYLSGDMAKPSRIQAPYTSETEVKAVVKYLADAYEDRLPQEIDFSGENLSGNNGSDAIFAASIDDEDEDDLYENAHQAVLEAGRASTSYLQRKLRVGYARAARLMDILEERGVIGPADGAKPREVFNATAEEEDESEVSDSYENER